ncbi:MAG: hypothetical protein IK115_03945 [Lachnospiraceae bacterium]|nr:hypothetical protein [Lachnospiraceae bacterium]
MKCERKPAYGGFLPLELGRGKEPFSEYGDRLSRFNCVKAALDFLIKQLAVKRIFLPYYYCPSTTAALKATGAELVFYHIDEELKPETLPDEEDSAVILVDFFGVRRDESVERAKSFKNAQVILDRAHDIFAEAVMAGNIHNVYSAKKFYGVPDGAFLISESAAPCRLPDSRANEYAGYLLKAYEEGTNAAYAMKKEADLFLASHYGPMSALSRGLLANADHMAMKEIREANYKKLYEAFRETNRLQLPECCPAYLFPLLLPEQGRRIKKALIEEKIYISTLWAGKELAESGTDFEQGMRDDTVFLPLDQRYDAADMEYLISRVKQHMEN